jgi:hypothetical protein
MDQRSAVEVDGRPHFGVDRSDRPLRAVQVERPFAQAEGGSAFVEEFVPAGAAGAAANREIPSKAADIRLLVRLQVIAESDFSELARHRPSSLDKHLSCCTN